MENVLTDASFEAIAGHSWKRAFNAPITGKVEVVEEVAERKS